MTLKELQRATYRRPHDGDEADAAFRVAIIAGSVALVDVVIICDADVDANAGATFYCNSTRFMYSVCSD